MSKFRKKPVVIEAIQFTGTDENITAILAFAGTYLHISIMPGYVYADSRGPKSDGGNKVIEIQTLEGTMTASINDWIIKGIKGIKGEFYPCKPDVFEMTYEPVKENSNE